MSAQSEYIATVRLAARLLKPLGVDVGACNESGDGHE
jgi:hypothetical protein